MFPPPTLTKHRKERVYLIHLYDPQAGMRSSTGTRNEWEHPDSRRGICPQGFPRHQLHLTPRRTSAAGAAERILTREPRAQPPPAPPPRDAPGVFPNAPQASIPIPTAPPHITQHRPSAYPGVTAGPRRSRLAKRGIAPSRPTARARPHWLAATMGGACA